MIISFRHKGLETLYHHGSKKGVQAAHVPKLLRILSVLDVAKEPQEETIQTSRIHPLKGEISGNWTVGGNENTGNTLSAFWDSALKRPLRGWGYLV